MKKKISQETMDAMNSLLFNYENLIGMESCSLCDIHRIPTFPYGCGECPWVLFGHTSNHYVPCEKWSKKHSDEVTISYAREHPKEFPDVASKRINMLKHWIRNCEVV